MEGNSILFIVIKLLLIFLIEGKNLADFVLEFATATSHDPERDKDAMEANDRIEKQHAEYCGTCDKNPSRKYTLCVISCFYFVVKIANCDYSSRKYQFGRISKLLFHIYLWTVSSYSLLFHLLLVMTASDIAEWVMTYT